MIVDGIEFPAKALAYLDRHKGDKFDMQEACAAQVRRARKQLAYLQPLLNWDLGTLLDIGCGLAVVSTLYAKQGTLDTLHLMDGEAPSQRSAEYLEGMQPWNDVGEGLAMVQANACVGGLKVKAHKADPKFNDLVDCIWSFKSWGIHYPMHTYIPLAKRCLPQGGLLIVDVRPGTTGIQELVQAGFTWKQLVGPPDSIRNAFTKA